MAPGRNSPRATCLQGEMATRPSRRASRPKRKRFSKRGKLNLPFVAFPRRKQKRERPRSLRCQASSSCFLGEPLSKDTALVLVYQSERTRSRVLSYDAAWRQNFFLGSFNYWGSPWKQSYLLDRFTNQLICLSPSRILSQQKNPNSIFRAPALPKKGLWLYTMRTIPFVNQRDF